LRSTEVSRFCLLITKGQYGGKGKDRLQEQRQRDGVYAVG